MTEYQVVVSWQVPASPNVTVSEYRDNVESFLRRTLPGDHGPAALCVTAYEIGAHGEASEHEGMVGL